ncbi:MAG: HD domain-containing protein [Pirellulaceae bacterium]|nr:HD domain-containing protein [Pirellulaceae bacterium]
MLRVPLHKIQPGMVLARPIPAPSDPYRFLVQRGHEVPMDMVPRLRELGVLEVWVRHRGLEFLEDVIDEGLGECQREIYQQVRRNFESIMHNITTELDLGSFESSIGDLSQFLKSHAGSNILLQKLDAYDDYLMSHSTNVAYLSLLIGMKLDRYLIDERRHKTARDAKDIHLLGLGCLLHDVGKIMVAREIINKAGRLTPEEMAEIWKHPVHGHALVRGNVPTAAAQVVLNHHQRWDGNGYPPRTDARTGEAMPALTGRQIHIFSRIATMADVYDAATSRRCYSQAKLPVRVLYEMRTYCRGWFDPVVEQAFFRTVPPFPLGQIVKLSDGVEAAVVDFNPDHPTRPKVQCIRTPDGEAYKHPSLEEIDLALYPELSIASVDGENVVPYLHDQETGELADMLA